MTMTIISFYIDFSKMFKEWINNVDLYHGLSKQDREDLITW